MKKVVILFMCMAFVGTMVQFAKADKERQPHMKNAMELLISAKNEKVGDGKIRHLNAAKAELEKATADKGGHRVAAMQMIDNALAKIREKKMPAANKMIDNAIEQVRKGIRFDNKR